MLARAPSRVGGRVAASVGEACEVLRRPSMPDLGRSLSLTGETLVLWLDLRPRRLDGGGVFWTGETLGRRWPRRRRRPRRRFPPCRLR